MKMQDTLYCLILTRYIDYLEYDNVATYDKKNETVLAEELVLTFILWFFEVLEFYN